MAHKLVDLERDEQGGRDHGQPLGPALAVKEAAALDELEHAVSDRARPEDRDFVAAKPAKLRDQVTNPRPLWVELDPAREMVRNVAEVRTRLRDQVDPRRDKQDPPQ